ncbi:MAG TPA: GNAT family N-acetyltransferase [Candidatus Baltobacteraceae bacterium]|nr:GNAT family N-acetyltransferase [Candidatus Baltobacteraceae bacterium]
MDIDRWEAFDRAHPAPTFFARPAFTRAFCDAFPHAEPWPVLVEHKGEEYIVPAIRSHARLGFKHAVAFPLGGYSCVLNERGEPAAEPYYSEVLKKASGAFDTFSFVGWPLAAQPNISGASATTHSTAVVDCSLGREHVLRGMRGVTRRMIGQSARRGVCCVQSPTDAVSVSRYYAMLEEASARWGLTEPTISRELLDAVIARGGENVELWFAQLDGEAIAGGVILFGRDELFFWSAAMRRDFSQYRPSNALNARLLERAIERDVRWYNLGASEGLHGVERFKHDLGAHDVTYSALIVRSPGYRLYDSVRTALHVGAAS